MGIHPDFPKEKEYLKTTIQRIDETIAGFNVKQPRRKDWVLHLLWRMWVANKRRLEEVRGEPYFGRFDFRRLNESDTTAFYVGRVGAPGVTDWRAPIATLFYDGAGGEVKYTAPEGAVNGFLSKRRQYRITEGELLEFFDSLVEDSVMQSVLGQGPGEWADPKLIYELETRSGERLKDIIATIQSEQNAVIRTSFDRVVILQGVAGSGKTTVALHRVAYLLYAYPVQVRPDRILVLAPNRLFLQYIEELLPMGLGVSGVIQSTFSQWASELTGVAVAPSIRGVPALSSFLRADGARNTLQIYIERFVRRIVLPSVDLKLWEGHVVTAQKVQSWFRHDYVDRPVLDRINRIRQRLRYEKDELIKKLERQWSWEYDAGRKDRSPSNLKPVKKRINDALKQYEAQLPGDDLHVLLWQSFLSDEDGASSIIGPEYAAELRRLALHLEGKSPSATADDMPAVCFIRDTLAGISERQRYDHVVVDEAQDMTPLSCTVLALRCNRSSFTLVGDLAQSMTPGERYTWDEVVGDAFPIEKTSRFKFARSYRSTREIILFARRLLEQAGVPGTLPEPVPRSGEEPTVHECASHAGMVDQVAACLDELMGKYRSIAIVTPDVARAREIHRELDDKGIELSLVATADETRGSAMIVLPVDLVRGLEFDAVLVVDAGEEEYPAGPMSVRRLYVALTRALHSLHVFYAGRPSPLLPS